MNKLINPTYIVALKSEFETVDNTVLYSGVGKLNAAIATMKSIHQQNPISIINVGTAGSDKFKYGTLVNCTKFVQRDMNTNDPEKKFITPCSNDSQILEYGIQIDGLEQGICGTGDTFVSDLKNQIYNLVDMESYAIAKICKENNIPFLCVKFISDGADENADKQWHTVLEDAKKSLTDFHKKQIIYQ